MLYLECYSGISGDMFAAAMISLGANQEKLMKALESLKLDAQIQIGRTEKCGIQATSFVVQTEDHMHHDKEHHESHEEHYEGRHEGHYEGHEHRNLKDVTDIILASSMTDRAKETALRIFRILAEAEGKVHGSLPEEVHFHEVGAVDSIIDIAAAAVCLDDLGFTEARITPIAAGRGHVKCRHGLMPLPAPAVVEIAKSAGLRLVPTEEDGETVTPTGAAIAAALYSGSTIKGSYKILRSGTGAGSKDFPWANVLRAYDIEEGVKVDVTGGDAAKESGIIMLETNIDDCSSEALGFVAERLMKEGARDVFYVPAFMKKGRPAYLLKVVCETGDREKMEDLIFKHTSTIGIRCVAVDRTALPRRIMFVDTPYGKARVKVVTRKGETFCYPEYEDVAAIALSSGRSFDGVYEEIRWSATKDLHD
ncbi:MAG: nickel pincer cofactor biosynthesis protein LarC [Clostridia bacterium]|nr:nickel pincer cofactor biosynthesis protein LarC [Clostridia bacterium]